MATIRNLLSQARQIRASKSYTDTNFLDGDSNMITDNATRSAEAKTNTAFLEDDLNVLRTMVKEITGNATWTDAPTTNLDTLKNLGGKYLIQPVQNNVTVSKDATSIEISTLTAGTFVEGTSATTVDGAVGYVYTDTSVAANVVEGTQAYISIRDKETNMPILDVNERKVFGIAGSYDDNGTQKIQVTFYTDIDGTYTVIDSTNAVFTEEGGSDIEMILPQRAILSDVNENFAMVNAGFADAVGSFEIGNLVYDAEQYMGTFGGAGAGTDLSAVRNFSTNNEADITSAIKELFSKVSGNMNSTRQFDAISGITGTTTGETLFDSGYVDASETLVDGIKKLDIELARVENIANSASAETVVSALTEDIVTATEVELPLSKTYADTDFNAMDIYLNGMKLTSTETLQNSQGNTDNEGDFHLVAGDGTTSTKVVFNLDLIIGDVISYQIFNSGN